MRLRLMLSFALVVLVSVVGVVIIARQGTVNEVRSFIFHGITADVRVLAGRLEQYYARNQSWEGVSETFTAELWSARAGYGMGPGITGMGLHMNRRLRLADASSRIILDSEDPIPTGRLNAVEKGLSVPLYYRREVVGYLLPQAGMIFTQSDERFLLNRLNRAAVLAGLFAGFFALAVALYLAYRLLRPVQELTLAARKLALGDLSQRVSAEGHDELAALGQSFNQMADSLQRSEESRRALTADIAHELRNPLAVQRANLEALQDGIYSLSEEHLEPILEQNLLLTRLVDDLATLAMAESGKLHLEMTSTDIPRLVGRVTERYRAQAQANQVELLLEVEGSVPHLMVDPGRIEQILNNLLSNALRYTPRGGCVWVSLTSAPLAVQLSVRDSGPGIPEEALPFVFERFYRADRSRSRAEGGAGLGLAIARQLARAHGGDLIARNHPQGSAVITLTLPLRKTGT